MLIKKKIAILSVLFGMYFVSDGRVAAATGVAEETKGDYVILLHGMHRTRISMKRLERELTKAGYEVINKTYPSRRRPIEYIANEHLTKVIAEHATDAGRKIHFVTHSLGGIVVRQFLSDNTVPNLGKVVMLAPPNQGSELTDFFRKWLPIYPHVMGPAAMQLGTTENDRPLELGAVNFELGVIAGDRSLNPLYSSLIEGADDGKVSVARAKVEGMKDFYVSHTSHTWLMNRRSIIGQIKRFIETGEFEQPQG